MLAFLMHHKTGTHLADATIGALHLKEWEYKRDDHFPRGVIKHDFNFNKVFNSGSMKVIHFVRDP